MDGGGEFLDIDSAGSPDQHRKKDDQITRLDIGGRSLFVEYNTQHAAESKEETKNLSPGNGISGDIIMGENQYHKGQKVAYQGAMRGRRQIQPKVKKGNLNDEKQGKDKKLAGLLSVDVQRLASQNSP